MRFIILLSLFLILLSTGASAAVSKEFVDAAKDYEIKIPEDFNYKKDYRIQWWYFTGHLYNDQGREFGYELTFFIVNVQKKKLQSEFGVNRLYISHFGITDIMNNTFYINDKGDSGAFGFAGVNGNELKVWVEGNTLERSGGDNFHISASDDTKSVDLLLSPAKPVALHGDKGYFRKSEESPLVASHYFSYTSMHTSGTITLGKNTFKVHGKSWFDREFLSNLIGDKLAGWDWFAVQLDDNREIMLCIFRKKDGSPDMYSSGTFIYADGRFRNLSFSDFSVRALSYYKSEKTGARYPSEWEIKIPSENINIKVRPLAHDQEVQAYKTTGNRYWEGACKVEGSAKGRAYAEMTGY